jgi:hypothetical protein
MSDKRRGDMASIEIDLQRASQPSPTASSTPTVGVDDTSPIDTVLAPVPGTPSVVPGDEKVYPKQDDTDEEDADSRQEDALLRQNQLRRQKLFERGSNAAWGAANSVKNGIGKIPIPMGLTFAVLALVVLFFLLVQVNGKSRVSWLWLVLSGNAYVSGEKNGVLDTTPTPTTPTTNATGTTSIPVGTFGGTDAGGYGGGASGNFGSSAGTFGGTDAGGFGGGASGNFSSPGTFGGTNTGGYGGGASGSFAPIASYDAMGELS